MKRTGITEDDIQFGTDLPGVIVLLLEDHKAMRKLMHKVKSPRSAYGTAVSSFKTLWDLVVSHMKSEEVALVNHLKAHPLFKDEATESYEEHRVHETIVAGIHRLKDPKRRLAQMQIYCEMLEHHLGEEEEDLFPKYKKHFALSTRKKAGKKFLRKRVKTATKRARIGAL